MAAKTEAQEEFDSILLKASAPAKLGHHPDDAEDYQHDRENEDRDEEDEYRQSKIDESMRMPLFERSNGGASGLRLPHREFDEGRTTGVKGVIADARSYEEARRSGNWRDRISRHIGAIDKSRSVSNTRYKDLEDGSVSDDEEFLERWREARRQELQGAGNDIRNRRTSPSCRRYGRFDEVDALGYLDAIEKVGRETVVVVFVYDHECPVSTAISDALIPLVAVNPTVHFVRVHYEEIEFDNAGVPAILAYKNQGDLFANLTYIIDQIPDDTDFDTKALETILKKHKIIEPRDAR